ncbi:MAG TPA: UDP-glucose 4-epimerase GalE [Ktedonobacterales bacterium]|nr:UDP-glucose 4-epimerase GalE [Ktedonobacterales bacterium]
MRILVTGGAGYIGSHVVRLLRERGDEVVVFDNLETGHRAAIGDVPVVVGNIADSDLITQTCREYGVEAAMHFAAYKAVGESMERPSRYFANNVHGTAALIDGLHQAGIRSFIFSSSAAVYGTPQTLPVSETNPLHPENPNAESKAMVEQMLHWFDVCYGMRFASLRYFNAAGASLDAKIGEDFRVATNLVPLVMKAALGKIPAIQVFGTDYPTPDGTCIRDYIHIVDLAEAHLKALDFLQAGGNSEIFNLGIGKGASVKEVINTARRISEIDIPVIYLERRKGDPTAVYADNTKARTLLHWEPRYGLEEIIRTAWQWHSTHPNGYE